MSDKRKKILIVIFIVFLIFGIVRGTYAYWSWNTLDDQSTLVDVTIEEGFMCRVDGGEKTVGSSSVSLMPTNCTNSNNAIIKEITADMSFEGGELTAYLSLWLTVNQVAPELAKTTHFKYAVTTTPTSCTENVLAEGNFYDIEEGDRIYILDETYEGEFGSTINEKLYLYIWLDAEETNVATAGKSFSFSLGGTCDDFNVPEAPALDAGMVPVSISDEGTVTTVLSTDRHWYDYVDKEWANAILVSDTSRKKYLNTKNVVVNEADILGYYTWIPRYKYKIWTVDASKTTSPQTIDIVFEDGEDPLTLGNAVGQYRTHPAFWWDVDNNGEVADYELLPGIWVGKFETTGSADIPTVKPNVTSLNNQNVSTQFATSQKFQVDGFAKYGLTSKTDAHMAKNSEWGAVAYLSHSVFGINSEIRLNNNSNYMTGCGALEENGAVTSTCENAFGSVEEYPQSTTGNITGVFDMVGGTWEYVMGGYGVVGDSGFGEMPQSKYYNGYPFNGDYMTNLSLCTLETCGGHALYETDGWYSDSGGFFVDHGFNLDSFGQWFTRGGIYNNINSAGIFAYTPDYGNAYESKSFRSVLVPIKDIEPPTCTISVTKNSTKVTATYSDNMGVVGYYFGKNQPDTVTQFVPLDVNDSGTQNATVGGTGTYNFVFKDVGGNIGVCSGESIKNSSYRYCPTGYLLYNGVDCRKKTGQTCGGSCNCKDNANPQSIIQGTCSSGSCSCASGFSATNDTCYCNTNYSYAYGQTGYKCASGYTLLKSGSAGYCFKVN